MSMRGRSLQIVAVGLALGCVGGACTAAREATAPSTSLRPTTSPVPAAESMSPLALVVHRGNPQRTVSARTARALVAGAVVTGGQFGLSTATPRLLVGPRVDAIGARPMQTDADVVGAVSRDRDLIGAVPAGAVTPFVRVLTLDGIDPLRDPTRYPLTTPGAAGASTTITIAGDVMLGRRVGVRMARIDDFAAPLRPMAARLAAADVTIANLESTLSRDGAPTQGGDSFAADPRVEAGLKVAGIDVVSLANNHVGDWGSRALVQTVDAVRAMDISPVGAGRDLAEARRPVVVSIGGVRVGILATDSIGESPAAGAASAGTNRIDMPPRTGPLDQQARDRVVDDIAALKRAADVVIVIPHWGAQYTHAPEQAQRDLGGAMVRAGADLVVGGHPHWVQGVEAVEGERGLIVHSLGNFVFDMDFMRRTREGVVLEAVVWNDKVAALDFTPYVIGGDFAPRAVTGERAEAVLRPFRAGSDAPFDRG